MSNKLYPYLAEQVLDDGTCLLLDLEERGWADKDRLARTVRFSLIPKDDGPKTLAGTDYPLVMVDIPAGAKPVFKADVYGSFGSQVAADLIVPSLIPQFRIYAVGWKKGSEERLTWVLPTGGLYFGTDENVTQIGHQLLNALNGIS